jgi:hypothetical protein
MSNLWESAICNEYALIYAKYAKYVNKNTIFRICTNHFADVLVQARPASDEPLHLNLLPACEGIQVAGQKTDTESNSDEHWHSLGRSNQVTRLGKINPNQKPHARRPQSLALSWSFRLTPRRSLPVPPVHPTTQHGHLSRLAVGPFGLLRVSRARDPTKQRRGQCARGRPSPARACMCSVLAARVAAYPPGADAVR